MKVEQCISIAGFGNLANIDFGDTILVELIRQDFVTKCSTNRRRNSFGEFLGGVSKTNGWIQFNGN